MNASEDQRGSSATGAVAASGGRGEEQGLVSNLVGKVNGFVADRRRWRRSPSLRRRWSRECITLHNHVDVNNPYAHRIPICEITYTFKIAGKVIASGAMPDPGWIAASGSTKLELPVKVPCHFIVTLVKDPGRDWDIDYVLEVGLTIDLPRHRQLHHPAHYRGGDEA